MGLLILAISSILAVLILLWVSLIALWTGAGFDGNQIAEIALVSGVIVVTLVAAATLLFSINRSRLDRARAMALETELARNLVTVNEYRKAVLDLEKATNGK
jgi:membrane protein implicated in regulation of membrane protease activity